MRALIVSSGSINNLKLLKYLLSKNDFVLCADGGIDHLMKIGEIPDLVLGDFDSISKAGLKYIKDKNINFKRFPEKKDETDTELGIIDLFQRGYKDITMTGVTGTRLDHTIANIFLLKTLGIKGINAKIVDDNNTIYFVNEFLKLDKSDNYTSIIPLSRDGITISLKGFLYPLNRETMDFGSTRGISNLIKEDCGIVEIYRGEALVIQSRD